MSYAPRFFSIKIREFFDVHPGEGRRIGLMATVLFFLLAANNVIKIVRDSLFLSRFPITQLPYVYLSAGLIAAALIGIYSRYTATISLSQVILRSYVFIISNVVIFWVLISFWDFAWVLYAFYMWSAIVGLVALSQFWTLADEVFNPREGKRLFGILTAAGTLGAISGGLGANLAVNFLFGTKQLLWLIVVPFVAAFGVARFALGRSALGHRQDVLLNETQDRNASGIVGALRRSQYLRAIAVLIFISITVSTLIDYQFKAAAKEAYNTADTLAAFFSSYYAWLEVVTLVLQVWLTPRLFRHLGLTPSLLLLPFMLCAGCVSFLVWPGLFSATATRLTEASMRTSVNGTGLEILYVPIPNVIKHQVKVFLDVTVTRLGDGAAASIILFCSVVLGCPDASVVTYFSVGLLFVWIAIVFVARQGYIDALRNTLAYREIPLERTPIDFSDKETIDTFLKTLDDKNERAVLFGLEFAAKSDPGIVVPRIPRRLLRHPSVEVRAQAMRLFATLPDRSTENEICKMLQDENSDVQAEAINAASAIFKADAVALVRPYIEGPAANVKGRAIECLLRYGDEVTRKKTLDSFLAMLSGAKSQREQDRIEAIRVMGNVQEPTFAAHLGRLVREGSSSRVVREAMAAAAKGKYFEVIDDIVSRLGAKDTKAGARDALLEYGAITVVGLRKALFDSRVSREIRLNIPRTLSKIHSQSAMDALLAGLSEEDHSIRFQAILGVEEMARRFPELSVDRELIENAIISDAMLYSRRFAVFFTLFGSRDKPVKGPSLLYFALTDSMERVKQRLIWLLSLVHPGNDIRRAWSGLSSEEPAQRANAVEFLDNLLVGRIKKFVFSIYSDDPQDQRMRAALNLLGMDGMDTDSALRELLDNGERWLKAATIWEIGDRGLAGFTESISKFISSEDVMLCQTANLVLQEDLGSMAEPSSLSTVEKVLFLKTVAVLEHAPIEEIGRIAALMEEAYFKSGQTIYREGERVHAIYIILSGRARLERNGKIVQEAGEKDSLGVLAVFDPDAADYTITATEPMHALKLTVQDFGDILSVNFELVKAVVRAMARRVRQAFSF